MADAVLFYRDLQAIVSDQGVPQDYVQAHMWFNLAAATKALDTVAKRMTPAQIAEAQLRLVV